MVAKKMGRVPAGADSAAHGDSTEVSADSASSASSTPSVHLLENLVLNPAGSGGSRFLLLSVAIEAGSSSMTTEFQARDAELRDIILTALGG